MSAETCRQVVARCLRRSSGLVSFARQLSGCGRERAAGAVEDGVLMFAAIQGIVYYALLRGDERCASVRSEMERGGALVCMAIGEGKNSRPSLLRTVVSASDEPHGDVRSLDGAAVMHTGAEGPPAAPQSPAPARRRFVCGKKNFSTAAEWATHAVVLARDLTCAAGASHPSPSPPSSSPASYSSSSSHIPIVLELVDMQAARKTNRAVLGEQRLAPNVPGIRHGPIIFNHASSLCTLVGPERGFWVASRTFRMLEDLTLSLVHLDRVDETTPHSERARSTRDCVTSALEAAAADPDAARTVQQWLGAMERVEVFASECEDAPPALAPLLAIGRRVRERTRERLSAPSPSL